MRAAGYTNAFDVAARRSACEMLGRAIAVDAYANPQLEYRHDAASSSRSETPRESFSSSAYSRSSSPDPKRRRLPGGVRGADPPVAAMDAQDPPDEVLNHTEAGPGVAAAVQPVVVDLTGGSEEEVKVEMEYVQPTAIAGAGSAEAVAGAAASAAYAAGGPRRACASCAASVCDGSVHQSPWRTRPVAGSIWGPLSGCGPRETAVCAPKAGGAPKARGGPATVACPTGSCLSSPGFPAESRDAGRDDRRNLSILQRRLRGCVSWVQIDAGFNYETLRCLARRVSLSTRGLKQDLAQRLAAELTRLGGDGGGALAARNGTAEGEGIRGSAAATGALVFSPVKPPARSGVDGPRGRPAVERGLVGAAAPPPAVPNQPAAVRAPDAPGGAAAAVTASGPPGRCGCAPGPLLGAGAAAPAAQAHAWTAELGAAAALNMDEPEMGARKVGRKPLEPVSRPPGAKRASSRAAKQRDMRKESEAYVPRIACHMSLPVGKVRRGTSSTSISAGKPSPGVSVPPGFSSPCGFLLPVAIYSPFSFVSPGCPGVAVLPIGVSSFLFFSPTASFSPGCGTHASAPVDYWRPEGGGWSEPISAAAPRSGYWLQGVDRKSVV